MEIFKNEFLAPYLETFPEAAIIGFEEKKEIINNWIAAIGEGKLERTKEETIKSRFVMDIFDNVLGYKYHNTNCWLLEEELKSAIDGTKPDAAFGFYTLNKEAKVSDVRMVAEFKDSNTALDKPQQSRKVKISPVDQAFLYASKMSGDCRWVVVCNPLEIRFYHYSSQSCFQRYLIKDLGDDMNLKEMVFLFGAERLIARKGESKTDKLFRLSKVKTANPDKEIKHVVDHLYESLRKFDGLTFIDPDFLSNLYPFNIFPDKVYHYNGEGVLLTLNPEIYRLLKEVEILDGEITFSAKFAANWDTEKIVDLAGKLGFVFKRLNECLIFEVLAIEDYQKVVALNKKQKAINFSVHFMSGFHEEQGVLKDVKVLPDEECDCYICNYRSLDFAKLIQKVRAPDFGNQLLDKAFGHYLVRSTNHDESFDSLVNALVKLKGRADKIPEYFIALYNLKYSKNFFVYKRIGAADHIKTRWKAIDLDDVMATEVDIYVDNNVRQYLIQLKDGKLVKDIESRIEEILAKLKDTRKLLNGKYNSYSGTDYLTELRFLCLKLYSHFFLNRIMGDMFSGIERLYSKIFACYLESYQTKGFGITAFDSFTILDAVLHIQPSNFSKMLSVLDWIELEGDCKKNLLDYAENMLSSYVKQGAFGVSENDLISNQIQNPWFENHYWNVFSNLFSLLSKVKLDPSEITHINKLIVDLICLNVRVAWFRLTSMTNFIQHNAKSFQTDQLKAIIIFCAQNMRPHNHKYDEILSSACFAWDESRGGDMLDDEKTIRIAIANTMGGRDQEYLKLTYLWMISSEPLKKLIIMEIDDYLEKNFSAHLYVKLLHREVIKYDYKDYFKKYVAYVNKSKSSTGFLRSIDPGKPVRDFTVLNLACILYRFGVNPKNGILDALDDLSDFDLWLLNPKAFDYSKFDIEWLEDVQQPAVLNELKGIPSLQKFVEQSLIEKYNGKLAATYFEYII